MMTHYRLLFTNLTWRNPDGRSPFWQNWGLAEVLPTFTASDLPVISILSLLLIATGLAGFLYARTSAPQPELPDGDVLS